MFRNPKLHSELSHLTCGMIEKVKLYNGRYILESANSVILERSNGTASRICHYLVVKNRHAFILGGIASFDSY